MLDFTIKDLAFISYSIKLKNETDTKELERAKKENDKESITYFENQIIRNNTILQKIEKGL